jgi:hypothetical protein
LFEIFFKKSGVRLDEHFCEGGFEAAKFFELILTVNVKTNVAEIKRISHPVHKFLLFFVEMLKQILLKKFCERNFVVNVQEICVLKQLFLVYFFFKFKQEKMSKRLELAKIFWDKVQFE